MQRRVLVFAGIGLLFGALYACIGLRVGARGLFLNDVFFHSDTERVLNDLTLWDSTHNRTNVHPLFVLVTNPFGLLLARLFNSISTAAVILNSLAGGVSVGLAGWFLQAAGVPLRRAVLFAAILGCSTGQLFFGSVPETYAFSGLSITILFCCLLGAPGRLARFLPAGLFSFGVLITNLAFAAITYAASLWPSESFRRWVSRTAMFVFVVVLAAIALAGVQRLIWRKSTLFFVPAAYAGESRFVNGEKAPAAVLQRVGLLCRHVFVFDWVSPPLFVQPNEKHQVKVGFDPHSIRKLHKAGRWAAGLWVLCLAAAAANFAGGQLFRRPVPLALALCLAFHLLLHTLYGDDFFLYACNSCFLVLAFIAVCTMELPCVRRAPVLLESVLAAVLVLEICSNWQFAETLVSIP